MIPFLDYFVQKAHAAASSPILKSTTSAAPATNNSGQGALPPVIGPYGQPTTGNSDPVTIINSLYGDIFNILTVAAAILAVIYLVWSGIQYVTAGGSAEKAKTARTGVINAVIGIVIIVAAYTIIRIGISIGNQINSSI